MSHHWHISIENIIIYGVSAILVINFTRFLAEALSKNSGTATIGNALGAIVS
jgi:hypothetical protein